MRGNIPSRRKAITSAIILATVSLQVAAQQDDPEVEEVLVTGSYIRGTPLDAPSPVTTVDRTSIEAQGAAQIWDVIKNLEINSGSFTNEGSGEGAGLSGTANVNLRNLGENSTLTLINGKRQVSAATTTRSGGEFVDINSIPLVMVERVEVLTDGGSALYGSDAVAGVVNVIMRTQFEGLEVYGDVQALDAYKSAQDRTGSVIWGWASDSGDTHLVLSGEKFERDPVQVEYGSFYDENVEYTGVVGGIANNVSATMANAAFGSRLNPAYINSALTAQNIAEGGPTTQVLTDPLCTQLKGNDGRSFFTGTRTEQRGANTGNCREFTEEVGITSTPPFIDLGSIRQRGGKTVFAWAFEGKWDSTQGIQSNHVSIEWPVGSGQWSSWPEIDRAGFYTPAAAKERMKLAQHPFIDRLADALALARYARLSAA